MAYITKRGSSYSVRYTYQDEHGKSCDKWESFPTKEEAVKRQKQIEHELATGNFLIPSTVTVAEFLMDWLPKQCSKHKWAPKTYQSNLALIQNLIIPYIGEMQMQKLLTHAIEGYITKGHCTISDMFHLEAIKLISENLRGAVQNTPEGREGMALGQYIAGMGFSNVGLGIVHSMAHGLSALYDTPHGVACAILLPVGLEYNKTVAGERYRAVGKAMGVKGIDEMNDAEAADATIAAVKQLSADVGIPTNLHGILKEEDIQFLAESAYADACRPGNPRDTSVEEIVELYKSQL